MRNVTRPKSLWGVSLRPNTQDHDHPSTEGAFIPWPGVVLALVILVSGACDWVDASDALALENFFKPDEVDRVLHGEILNCSRYGKKIKNTDGSQTAPKPPPTSYIPARLTDYEVVTIEKAFFSCDLEIQSKLALYNYLQAYSTIAGTQYYSQTDRKVRTMVLESYRVDPIGLKRRERDRVHIDIRDHQSDIVFTRDNRYGKVFFQSEVFHQNGQLVGKMTNIKPLSVFRIRTIEKGEYQLFSFYLYDEAKQGYFYCAVHAMKIRGSVIQRLGRLSPESFANRVRATTVHMAKFFGLDWSQRLKVF